MMSRIWAAFAAEIVKARRRKFSFVGLLLVILAVVTTALVRPVMGIGPAGYEFIAHSMSVALNLLGLFLLITFCAGLVSSEISNGSICIALVRPVRRHEYVAAKILLGMAYAILIMLSASGTAWVIALVFGRLTGVSFGGELLFTNFEMIKSFAMGALMSVLPYFAAVAFAVFISAAVRSVAAAIGATLGIWILVDLVKYPLGIGRYWFSTYMETPWQVFSNRCSGLDATWWPDAAWLVATSVLWGVLFSFLAMVLLSKLDLRA